MRENQTLTPEWQFTTPYITAQYTTPHHTTQLKCAQQRQQTQQDTPTTTTNSNPTPTTTQLNTAQLNNESARTIEESLVFLQEGFNLLDARYQDGSGCLVVGALHPQVELLGLGGILDAEILEGFPPVVFLLEGLRPLPHHLLLFSGREKVVDIGVVDVELGVEARQGVLGVTVLCDTHVFGLGIDLFDLGKVGLRCLPVLENFPYLARLLFRFTRYTLNNICLHDASRKKRKE